jgi:dienelactone hydrolase
MRAAAPLAVALLAAAALAAATPSAGPDIRPVVLRTAPLPYADGEIALEGHLAWDEGLEGPRPVVLVVHEWWGLGDHARRSAERLAGHGWLALAVDMYGKGRLTKDPKEAGGWAGPFRKEPALAVARLRAALAALKARPEADLSRVACIGFCFGGTVSLEAAWAGMDLRAAVSFHGNPSAPGPERAKGVKASVLLLHGADDPLVPDAALAAFLDGMKDHHFDGVYVALGGAVHSFTNPDADGAVNPAAKHHPVAAARSWAFAEDFLEERMR